MFYLARVHAHFRWFERGGWGWGVGVGVGAGGRCGLPFVFPRRIEKRFKRLWPDAAYSQIKSFLSLNISADPEQKTSADSSAASSLECAMANRAEDVAVNVCLPTPPQPAPPRTSSPGLTTAEPASQSWSFAPSNAVCVQFVFTFSPTLVHDFVQSRPPRPRAPFHSCFSPGGIKCLPLTLWNHPSHRLFRSDIFSTGD